MIKSLHMTFNQSDFGNSIICTLYIHPKSRLKKIIICIVCKDGSGLVSQTTVLILLVGYLPVVLIRYTDTRQNTYKGEKRARETHDGDNFL